MKSDLGAEVRRIREAKKLSLRAVAAAVGISPSLLSQVETGKTQPSVSTLYALVNYLGISLDGLLGHRRDEGSAIGLEESPDAGSHGAVRRSDSIVQRREDNPVIEMENGVTWERLAVGDSAVADPLIVTYAPAGSSSVEGKMMRHAALEYGILLEGRLTLRIDFETYKLTPGDSFCFDAQRPHLYLNEGDAPARGVWFVIGRREMAYQTLADLGHPEAGEVVGDRSINSAVDVLRELKSMRPEPRGA